MSSPSVFVLDGASDSDEDVSADSTVAEAVLASRCSERIDLCVLVVGEDNRSEDAVDDGGGLATERKGGGSSVDIRSVVVVPNALTF